MADRCDLSPAACKREHIVAVMGGEQAAKRCPAHDDLHASFSINPGERVRMVWHDQAGCSAEDVREALLALGISACCLGPYGTPKQQRASSSYRDLADPAVIADARRWAAVLKLPAGLLPPLMQMCLQALSEGDGNLAGDPVRLLPADSKQFYALAVRAGIRGHYKYQVFNHWASKWLGLRP